MKAVFVFLLAMTCCVDALGADVVVTRPTDLRADRYSDAAVLMALTAGMHVDLLSTEAGWVRARVDGRTGWLRATGLTGPGATVASLARLETGRSAGGNIVVAAGIRGMPKASKHALIIGVDAMSAKDPALRWPGVAHDVESARAIAERVGVPDVNVEILTGADATFDGIGAAIDRLAERVQPGDQVLVYFSGPGTQMTDGNRCVNAWATTDGAAWASAAVVGRMRPVLRDAGKLLIVSDAAYSPRPTTAGTTRKFYPMPAPRGCSAPGQTTSSLFEAAVAADLYGSNLVVMDGIGGTAAGNDSADGGGTFTIALTDCFLGDAIDADGSTSISIAEIGVCTNRRRHPTSARQEGGMVSVSGRGDYAPLIGVVPAAATTTTSASGKAPVTTSPRVVIEDLFAQRDSRIDVRLIASPDELRIGHDFLDLTLTSSRAGFVYLVLLGSDGKSFSLLFPNDLDRDNRIAAGETLHLPRPPWRVQSQGPAGHDLLLAIVAESERDLAPFAAQKEGPFGTALTDRAGRLQLQWLLGRSGRADSEACVAAGSRRNLAAVKTCSDAFGAALVGVVER